MDHISWADAINSGQGVVLGKWRSCLRHFANSFLNVIFVFQARDGSGCLWFWSGPLQPLLVCTADYISLFPQSLDCSDPGHISLCVPTASACPDTNFCPVLLSFHLFVYLTSCCCSFCSLSLPRWSTSDSWNKCPPCSSSPSSFSYVASCYYHAKWCWTCSLPISPMTHRLQATESWTFRPSGKYRGSYIFMDQWLFSLGAVECSSPG